MVSNVGLLKIISLWTIRIWYLVSFRFVSFYSSPFSLNMFFELLLIKFVAIFIQLPLFSHIMHTFELLHKFGKIVKSSTRMNEWMNRKMIHLVKDHAHSSPLLWTIFIAFRLVDFELKLMNELVQWTIRWVMVVIHWLRKLHELSVEMRNIKNMNSIQSLFGPEHVYRIKIQRFLF